MFFADLTRTWWWLVHKDLTRELRAPRMLPAMLLLGLLLALVIEMHIDLPRQEQGSLLGGLFWVAAFFAGTMALDRSFSGEREEGCWEALLLYPVAPGTIFLAKVSASFLALCCLDAVLAAAFGMISDFPVLQRPCSFLAVVVVANIGFAAVGTLLSALTNGLSQRGNLLVLLLLPLVSPVMLGAAQATRSLMSGEVNDWWRWEQFLACFAAAFVALGMLVFEFVIED
jgi:heme exporter protein B